MGFVQINNQYMKNQFKKVSVHAGTVLQIFFLMEQTQNHRYESKSLFTVLALGWGQSAPRDETSGCKEEP